MIIINQLRLFRLQKYKKFESNSQRVIIKCKRIIGCFDCKSTKNLRAIHNRIDERLVITALFRLQKYKKFESNSQPTFVKPSYLMSCFDCKSTKNLRAIHNQELRKEWEEELFRLQKYKKFESNSQRQNIL